MTRLVGTWNTVVQSENGPAAEGPYQRLLLELSAFIGVHRRPVGLLLGQPSHKQAVWLDVLPVGDEAAGNLATSGHWVVSINKRRIQRARVVWFWMTGEWPALQVDHKNRDFLDDRAENLQFLCPNCHSQTPGWCGSKGLAEVETAALRNRVARKNRRGRDS